MSRFVHALAYECNLGGISTHIKRHNKRTNECLKQLQGKGAKIVDVRLQIIGRQPPYSPVGTVVSLITYEADAPIEIKT